jgi:hypothetical protein
MGQTFAKRHHLIASRFGGWPIWAAVGRLEFADKSARCVPCAFSFHWIQGAEVMSTALSVVLGGDFVPLPTLANDVCRSAARRLHESPYHVLRSLSCEFRDGVLILRGSVDSFYLKQVAQTAVLGIPCVDSVDNRVEVESQ